MKDVEMKTVKLV